MRTTALFLFLLTLAAAPAAAQITEFQDFTGSADCNGWSVDATVHYWEGARMVRLEYDVVLSDADGVEVERSSYAEWIPFTAGETAVMSLGGSWSATPDAGWRVQGDFALLDVMPDAENRSEESFVTALDCAVPVDPDAPLCTRTANWYLKHPDQWPVDEVSVAGETLDVATACRLLARRSRGLLPVILARQVVAAKLNLAANPQAGEDVVAAVEKADAWLEENSPFQRFRRRYLKSRRWRAQLFLVRDLFRPLMVFNAQGCKDDGTTPLAVVDDLDKMLEEKTVPSEETSFGALKAMYR